MEKKVRERDVKDYKVLTARAQAGLFVVVGRMGGC
jgi:hypothetical protein